MKTTIPDNVAARALIRAINRQAVADAEGAAMDALFDGGEWSAGMHGPDRESVQRVLDHLGLTLFEATTLLDRFAKLDRGPWFPEAIGVASYIAEAFRDEYEHDGVHGKEANL